MEKRKDAANVRIFPPAIPLVTVLLGSALHWILPITSGFENTVPERYWIGAFIAIGAFLGLGLWSVLLLRRGGQSENPWKPTFYIEERGPFRLTRNPMYLQMILVCIGFGVAFANLWILFLTPAGAWCLQKLAILPEEAYLEDKFGDEYLSYQSRVGRWI